MASKQYLEVGGAIAVSVTLQKSVRAGVVNAQFASRRWARTREGCRVNEIEALMASHNRVGVKVRKKEQVFTCGEIGYDIAGCGGCSGFRETEINEAVSARAAGHDIVAQAAGEIIGTGSAGQLVIACSAPQCVAGGVTRERVGEIRTGDILDTREDIARGIAASRCLLDKIDLDAG